MESPLPRTILVTGGNRGIGLEACRQLSRQGHRILLTARDLPGGEAAAAALADEGLDVRFHPLDVTSEASITDLQQFVEKDLGRLDVLVNNAGIFLHAEDKGITTLKLETVRATLETNTLAPLRLCQAFLPLMRKQKYGRIVNVSSGMGQIARLREISSAYRLSKTALNAVTIMLAAAVREPDILINACHPGWVRTGMGGDSAPRSVNEGADTIVWLATLPAGGPHGGFFEDRQQIAW
ncbi:MAG: SDR family oxidoreductase [Anaerolineales bacterium]|nr:SDR family oxidoreductase [Anaerolineales bacterium]